MRLAAAPISWSAVSNPYELIDPRQIVDRDQQKAAGRAEAYRLFQSLFEDLGQLRPVELAGEVVVTGKVVEPAFVLVTLIDDAHDAMSARRLPVRTGKPAAGVFEPKDCVLAGLGADAILDAIAHTAAAIALLGLRYRAEPGLRGFFLDQLRESTAAGECRSITD